MMGLNILAPLNAAIGPAGDASVIMLGLPATTPDFGGGTVLPAADSWLIRYVAP
jgi:hypothetical protein